MRPLLPFPFPISIGIDICQIHRIYKIISSPTAARFVDRILTKDEQAWNGPRLRALVQQDVQQDVSKSTAVKTDADASLEGPGRNRRRNPEMWAAAAFLAGR
ncbi:hypothetical protein ESCO_003140 [Escovopsis weberi]|uniref:Uncharacterized protein n=1 Tax=Escovopsis weberi TaxID=150374 RepID=A0A0M8MSL6_ESCWE|nr:hypothetical protein ESCO_003140 [Escovopsis weberi]